MKIAENTSLSPDIKEGSEEFEVAAHTASEVLFKELLIQYYMPLEVWYTRTIIDKVFLHILILEFSHQITHS